MNKKLLAMAVAAGFAAPMSVQAAPTLYGQLQAEISSEDCDVKDIAGNCAQTVADGNIIQGGGGRFDTGVSVSDNKRGRLGVKGSEDLGGGLKAIYKFEWQVNTTNGNPNDGARESFVGLKGGFGQVELGRVKSAYKYYGGVKYDPFVTTEMEARRYGGMSTGAFGHNSFLSDTLAYQNKFGMVSMRITYNLDEQDNGTVANDSTDGDYTLGVKFGNKKWEAGVALAHDENMTTTGTIFGAPTAPASFDAAKIFGKVKFGMVTIRGQYEQTEKDLGWIVPGASEDGTILLVGADFKVGGKTTISAQIATNEVELVGAIPGTPDQEGDYLAIGVTHKFTKKTRVFAGYGESSIDNQAWTTGANNGRDALTVGMRIDF